MGTRPSPAGTAAATEPPAPPSAASSPPSGHSLAPASCPPQLLQLKRL